MSFFEYPTVGATQSKASGEPAASAFTFLENLPKGSWEKILPIVETRHFRLGDDIIKMGERDDSFYILSSGSVNVVVPDRRGRDTVIVEIPEGSVFGEIAFFDRQPRSATIRASSDGSAIRVTRANFEHLSAWYPVIARQMLLDLGRILALRLRWTSTKLRS
ncbi:MAG: cyclic nucleotide-binding domain-containing protein [Bradyrhizobium sp.]